jgi:hypothetical protein
MPQEISNPGNQIASFLRNDDVVYAASEHRRKDFHRIPVAPDDSTFLLYRTIFRGQLVSNGCWKAEKQGPQPRHPIRIFAPPQNYRNAAI